MAKNNRSETWRKYVLSVLSLTVATTLSLGVFTACSDGSEDTDDEDTAVSATDTQLIRNGNFEFYSDKDVEEVIEKRGVVNTPNNWTFSAGTPTSDTASGIIDTADWSYFTQTGGYPFTTYTKDDEEVTTFASVEDAAAHWEDDNVSAYDRLKFLEIYEDEIDDLDEDSEEAELFAEYSYSVDFEDVEFLAGDLGSGLTLHDDAAQRENGDTSVLMIHNKRTSENVLGTAQHYTSGTTITLAAGTAAKLSVWVRTDALTHYYADGEEETEVSRRGGAYIGITNTVGGTSLDQMQIKNINTKGEWKEYTVYVRASTFASSTFTVVLGLGQGSSSDRYENVNGYAFFDDVKCEIVTAEAYEEAVADDWNICTVDSLAKEKLFDADTVKGDTFALDLYAGFDAAADLLGDMSVSLTSEVSGSKTYTSESIHPSLGDSEENVTGLMTLSEIAASSNRYLQNVYKNDIDDKFPFDENGEILMLLSANGAAYTAKTGDITVAAGERMLVSFFVKTSDIASGLTGANAILVDGENRTSLTAFDSNDIATVDIDDENTDIYNGWVQCFFFLSNDTDEDKTCHIEFTYGPTSIVSTGRYDYADGYAAFANFETKSLTRTEYSYASTGDRAVSVSLTGKAENTSAFDEVSATARKDIESRPALPASFRGTLGGSLPVDPEGGSNVKPEQVYAGLVDAEYAENYYASSEAWRSILDTPAANGDEWWTGLFGNANRPLVIANGEEASYGFRSEDLSLSANSAQRVSLRVRLSEDAKAYVLLTDLSDPKTSGGALKANTPAVTYWYDDNGNICRIDPSSDEFDRHSDVLFTLGENGLYRRTGDPSAMYYANLYNYDTDDEGNYVTRDGTIAFYQHDGRYYAYYDLESDTYSTEVSCLPTEVGGETITRYDLRDTAFRTAVIEVDGAKAAGEWVTVSFYLRAGNEAKNYRLEVWSGSRDGSEPNPAGSYVIFDNYKNESTSDFDTIRNEAEEDIKLANGLGEDDNITDPAIALYYTFTFYDATTYLRYDATQDEEELGNPYGSYAQSSYEEQLVYLYWDDGIGAATGSPAYTFFLDYTSADVEVEKDDLGESDDTTDDTTETTTDNNIWLLISSGVLAVVLVAVIVLVIVRRHLEKRSRRQRVKAESTPAVRPLPRTRKAPEKKEEPAVPEDENDPYNN